MNLNLSTAVQTALEASQPLLAMESTIIAQGMPYPESLDFAQKAEALCREMGVVPATIAIINGVPQVGLDEAQLKFIAHDGSIRKVSRRELGIAASEQWGGATTVSATMHIAHMAGIPVFATGGIGGVHRGAEYSFDVSQDLTALREVPMIVVSAGAKAVLDLPKTIEMLETLGVCVVGYKTNTFPAFYSVDSGLEIPHRVNTAKEIVRLFQKNIETGMTKAILIANPVPLNHEIPRKEMEPVITGAVENARKTGIPGKDVTPFLLEQIVRATDGRSLKTNIALALNNVQLGANIARELSRAA
ncbi:MAG TPA: pseudouridine-5'-phosphate glycosidase [Candidatus Marinimicrobia bacterium]|nr:pseudouridine-5'-phosphate glycosidase [Candidatus Neomarinimicrobiota bacterium]